MGGSQELELSGVFFCITLIKFWHRKPYIFWNSTKNILLVNDDGISATGINALEAAFTAKGFNVFVIAPNCNKSGTAHAITITKEIEVNKVAPNKWSVVGFPADCVALSKHIITSYTMDAVVSGINIGANVGNSIFYSGTVGAAREAQFMGIPAFATSLNTYNPNCQYFSQSADIVVDIVTFFLNDSDTYPNDLININLPSAPTSEIKGIKSCLLSSRREANITQRTDHSAINSSFYSLGKLEDPVGAPGKCFDYDAVNDNYIALTNLTTMLEDNRKILDLERSLTQALEIFNMNSSKASASS